MTFAKDERAEYFTLIVHLLTSSVTRLKKLINLFSSIFLQAFGGEATGMKRMMVGVWL